MVQKRTFKCALLAIYVMGTVSTVLAQQVCLCRCKVISEEGFVATGNTVPNCFIFEFPGTTDGTIYTLGGIATQVPVKEGTTMKIYVSDSCDLICTTINSNEMQEAENGMNTNVVARNMDRAHCANVSGESPLPCQ